MMIPELSMAVTNEIAVNIVQFTIVTISHSSVIQAKPELELQTRFLMKRLGTTAIHCFNNFWFATKDSNVTWV